MIRIVGIIALLLHQIAFAADADIVWTESELRIIESLSISKLPPIPDSPSNQYADNALAKSLGKQLFFDKRFSKNQQFSCASCHQPEHYFTDGLPVAKGVQATGRNTPTVVGSAWQRWFYWDGRKDSLWSQALIPFEAPNEMGSSRTSVVKQFLEDIEYNHQYKKIFGYDPSELSDEDLALDAGPLGSKEMQENWNQLSKNAQRTINQVYVNIGKSLEAYQRTLTFKPTLFDRYAEQILNSATTAEPVLTDDQIAGLKLFINTEKTQCLQCHNTALLSNRGFHNVGSGTFSGTGLDFGRLFGLQAVLLDEFNCLGAYSDAKQDQCSALNFLNKRQHIPLQGAFKTPSLRNVRRSAPYFHDGRFKTLEDVIRFYNSPPKDNGPHELLPMGLDSEEIEQLVRFLETL